MRAAVLHVMIAVLLLASGLWPLVSHAAQPIVSDSRIKTFVYNPNEVFAVTTHYGYQSNIEFADKEIIDTVSVGDRIGWQIIPAGRRLFIRSMEENAHTNMTVVTNLRAYQFDLRSSASDAVFGSEQLTYVVRFFYPEENTRSSGYSNATDFMPPPAPINASYAPGALAGTAAQGSLVSPSPIVSAPAVAAKTSQALNYRYTYSGSPVSAPVKIYDDGASTYFRFQSASSPKISVVTARGEQMDIPVRELPGNLVAVDVIAPRFIVRQPSGQVTVYNESGGV
jgi:P-type conjugative transfer protein VirB9